jgi:hypothetical protein
MVSYLVPLHNIFQASCNFACVGAVQLAMRCQDPCIGISQYIQ